MTTPALGLAGKPWWTPRRARWLLVGVNVVWSIPAPLSTIVGLETGEYGRSGSPWIALPMGAVLAGLMLLHSLASARGTLPRGWPWTMVLLVLLAYIPILWFRWNWAGAQILVVASAVMLLRGRVRAVAVAVPILGTTVALIWQGTPSYMPAWQVTTYIVAWSVALTVVPAILYGAAQLVRILGDLYAARLELAQAAAQGEWSRVSRDLHDLLGQSLTAISLKGDLALALLHRDSSAAEAEIRSLTGVAREALRGSRAVIRGSHLPSVQAEADRAAHLLRAAGVDTQVQIALPDLPPPVEETLAWAIREGVTNVLRHSGAGRCSITAARHDGTVKLEIVNDRAARTVPGNPGGGLAGLAERAGELHGSATGERFPDGRFVLRVELPEVTG